MKRFLIFISALIIYNYSFCQADSTLFYFEEVGMFIKIPPGFEVVKAAEDKKLKIKGERAIEKANNIQVDASATINLLSINKGQFNYLNITATPYKQTTKNGWEKDNKDVKNMLYKSFVGKVAANNIDTASAVVKIDGLVMDKFEMTLRVTPSMTMNMLLFSKFYKGYDFGIAYVYVDYAIGKEFERMVYASSFKK